MQACDRKLAELNAEAAIVQTARNTYAQGLKRELAGSDLTGDTLSFS